MARLRPVEPRDIDSLYAISLATGDGGGDASALYRDGRMLGRIYSAPYAQLSPQTAFVAEDEDGVGGYIVGALDTAAFQQRLEQEWWPALREIYADPVGDAAEWDADQRRCFMIHHPSSTPEAVVSVYPAHIHMNLLPRLQGRGVGTALLEMWIDKAREQGVTGIHLGANAKNAGGIAFWTRSGFQPVAEIGRTAWFGMGL